MQSPPLLRTLLPALIPFLFASLAAGKVLDRGIGPVLVGLATTAIVLTMIRAFGERERREFADTPRFKRT